jgi:hypothetical protein
LLMVKFRISHPASIVPGVVETFPCLWVLARLATQRWYQGFQAALIEFVMARLNPWLAFRAVLIMDGLYGWPFRPG